MKHEGVFYQSYLDTAGNRTVGVGLHLKEPIAQKHISALGLNYLQVFSGQAKLTNAHVDYLLDATLATAISDARLVFSTFDQLSDNRQAVLVSMSFVLGRSRLAGFTDLVTAVQAGDFVAAASEIVDSQWYRSGGGAKVRLDELKESMLHDTPVSLAGGVQTDDKALLNAYFANRPAPCFIAGTPIDLPGGAFVPIEQIRMGDIVVCYDERENSGRGMPRLGKVTALRRDTAAFVLDFHGLGITPGHVTLCGDGPHEGRHMPIIDILRSDGAVVTREGELIRAATNCPVGSLEDRFVEVWAVGAGDGEDSVVPRVMERGLVRAGTRILLADRSSFTLLDRIREAGGELLDDGRVRLAAGAASGPFLLWADRLPTPVDYVLARSGISIDDLAPAGAGESVGTVGDGSAMGVSAGT